MTTKHPDLVEQLVGFLEALNSLHPLSDDTGFAFMRGEDIPGADPAFLRGVVTVRDTFLGLQRYLEVCGIKAPVPRLLIWRGDLAEAELERRMETPPVWAPPQEAPAPTDKKEPVNRRTRGRI